MNLGSAFTVLLTVSNGGGGSAVNVSPDALVTLGTGAAIKLSGPAPASATLNAGSLQIFTYTYSAVGIGNLIFNASASGTDLGSGAGVNSGIFASSSLNINFISVSITSVTLFPATVDLCQPFTVIMAVQNQGSGTLYSVSPYAMVEIGTASTGAVNSSSPNNLTLAPGASASFTFSGLVSGGGGPPPWSLGFFADVHVDPGCGSGLYTPDPGASNMISAGNGACSPTPSVTPSITPSPSPSFTATASAAPTLSLTPACPDLGWPDIQSSMVSAGNYVIGSRFTLSAPMTVQSMQLYIYSGGGNLHLGIYANSAGNVPGALLADSGNYPVSLGWMAVPLPPTALAAGDYWLAFSSDVAIYTGYGSSGSAATEFYAAYSYGALPAALIPDGYQSTRVSILAGACALGTLTPSPTGSLSATFTLTASPSVSFTSTFTPTPSATPSRTSSPSSTVTGSSTSTPSAVTGTCSSLEIFSDAYSLDQGYLSGVYGPAPPLDSASLNWLSPAYSGVSAWAPMQCAWIPQLPPTLATIPLALSVRAAGSYCDPGLPTPNYGSQGGPTHADWFMPADYGGGRGILAWDNWYSRRVISLPAGAIISSAWLTWSADDQSLAYVNGNLVPWAGPGGSWDMLAGPVDVAGMIPAGGGSFVLGFIVTNQNNGGGTGLVYRLDISYCLPSAATATKTSTPTWTVTPSSSATATPASGLTAFVATLTSTVTRTPTVTPTPGGSPSLPPLTLIVPSATPTLSQDELLLIRGIYPVPSTGPVTLYYTLREAADVTLRIYNVAGEKIWDAQVAAGAGVQTLVWPGANGGGSRSASGLYLLRLYAVTSAGEHDVGWGTAAIER